MQACNLDLGGGQVSESPSFLQEHFWFLEGTPLPFLALWVGTVGPFMEPCACIWLECDEAPG